MSYRKFGKNDVLINTIRTHPKVDLFIYSGTIFYNNVGNTPGEFRVQHNNVYMTDPGYENLYEYNIDRTSVGIEGTTTTGSNPLKMVRAQNCSCPACSLNPNMILSATATCLQVVILNMPVSRENLSLPHQAVAIV